jgi:pentatricopeptide repeat protein
MLQRSLCAHLDCNLSNLHRKLAFLTARRHSSPSAHNHARPLSVLRSPPSIDNLTSWTADATPFPEFAPVIDAFASNDPLDKTIRLVKSSPSLLPLFKDRKKIQGVATNLAQSAEPYRSIDILELAHKVGHTGKHGAYEAVAHHLASIKDWRLVLLCVSLGIDHLGKPTARLLNWRARALLELQQFGLLQDVLDGFDNAKLSPTERTYEIVLIGCLQNHDLDGAKHCIRRMQESLSLQNPRTLSLIGQFHRRFGIDPKVRQDALDILPQLSTSSAVNMLNNIIQSALDVKDVPICLDLLTLFEQSYVQEIITVLEVTHDPRTRKILPEVDLPEIPVDLKPDTRTFAIIMNYLIRRSNFQLAINIGETALRKRFPATEDIITSFVHAFFLQNCGNVALKMLSRISKPMKYEFGELHVRGAPKVDWRRIPNIINFPLTTRICNALLRGILRRQGLRHVPTIFAIMHANNLEPNARTLEILVSHMSSTRGVRPRTILEVLRNLSGSSFEVSVRHFHHLIRYILREEKRSYYGATWRSYAKTYMWPYARTYIRRNRSRRRSLGSGDQFDPLGGIDFGSHTGYGHTARPLLQSLVDRKVKSDPAVISLRIRRDALLHGETESVGGVFHTMTARGLHANHHHFAALMEGYAMMGDLETAREVMELARDAGASPNVVMYTILIHGYARKHDAGSAMRVFREMVEQGVYPDVSSIDAVVGAFYASGASRLARKHLIMLWPYIEPFPDSLQQANLMTLRINFRSLDSSRSKTKRTSKATPSIYRQLYRLLAAYQRYWSHLCSNLVYK